MKHAMNLSQVQTITANSDGTISVMFINHSQEEPAVVNVSDLIVYGEGEMLVTRWLREIAGQATEGSDGSLEN